MLPSRSINAILLLVPFIYIHCLEILLSLILRFWQIWLHLLLSLLFVLILVIDFDCLKLAFVCRSSLSWVDSLKVRWLKLYMSSAVEASLPLKLKRFLLMAIHVPGCWDWAYHPFNPFKLDLRIVSSCLFLILHISLVALEPLMVVIIFLGWTKCWIIFMVCGLLEDSGVTLSKLVVVRN